MFVFNSFFDLYKTCPADMLSIRLYDQSKKKYTNKKKIKTLEFFEVVRVSHPDSLLIILFASRPDEESLLTQPLILLRSLVSKR